MNTLRQSIREYLALRRGLGFKMNDAARPLAQFATFMEKRRASYVTQALALTWAQIPQHAQPSHWASRLCHVRQFARYRSASDPRTQIPASGLLPFKPKRARPFLYTDGQIQQLLKTTLHMPLSPKHRNICALQPWVYYCLFGLLSVSGLRLGEARNLKLDDVDLKAGVLTVRGGKFGKDRWIPLHTSTCKVLTRYLEKRKRHWAGRAVSSYLFVSSWGNRWTQARFIGRSMPPRGASVCAEQATVMDRACTTFVTDLPRRLWSTGTAPTKTRSAACRS
jgi:integrase